MAISFGGMLEFKTVAPEDSMILDQRFLKADQAGTADEPRDTIEVARKYERARPVSIHDGEELIAFLVYEALESESRALLAVFTYEVAVMRRRRAKD